MSVIIVYFLLLIMILICDIKHYRVRTEKILVELAKQSIIKPPAEFLLSYCINRSLLNSLCLPVVFIKREELDRFFYSKIRDLSDKIVFNLVRDHASHLNSNDLITKITKTDLIISTQPISLTNESNTVRHSSHNK